MAHSVIFMGGIGYQYGSMGMAGALNGAYLGPEYTKYFVNTEEQYPNTGEDASVAKGTASTVALVQQIREDDPDGTITLVTGSMGSIVGSRVNDHLIANGIPTERINMILLVNPAHGNGGYAARFPSSMAAPFTGISGGSPTQSGGANILSIQNQYDLISDAPAYLFNGLAWANAIMGFFTEHPKVSPNLSDPRNIIETSPDRTLTSILVYTPQLPLTLPLRLLGVPGPIVDLLDRLMRPWIETGYDRENPAALVPLTLAPTPDKWLGMAQSVLTGTLQALLPQASSATNNVAAESISTSPDVSLSATSAPEAPTQPKPAHHSEDPPQEEEQPIAETPDYQVAESRSRRVAESDEESADLLADVDEDAPQSSQEASEPSAGDPAADADGENPSDDTSDATGRGGSDQSGSSGTDDQRPSAKRDPSGAAA